MCRKINTIFIGDSFTYGSDVNYDENFVEIYKKSINQTLNLGCGGNGPIIEYATFVEYVKNLKLKILILLVKTPKIQCILEFIGGIFH